MPLARIVARAAASCATFARSNVAYFEFGGGGVKVVGLAGTGGEGGSNEDIRREVKQSGGV